MRVSLKINSHELGDYILEGGISVSKEERVSKSITCMNGDMYKKAVNKHNINVTFFDDLYDSVYTTIMGYMSPNPASVSYTDFETGTTLSGIFYITDNGYSAKKSIGSTTYITGASISLQEMR